MNKFYTIFLAKFIPRRYKLYPTIKRQLGAENLIAHRMDDGCKCATLVYIVSDAESEAAARYVATTNDRLSFRTNTGNQTDIFVFPLD